MAAENSIMENVAAEENDTRGMIEEEQDAEEARSGARSMVKYRGKGKKGFLKSAYERKRTNDRNFESLNNKISKWTDKTGLPTVALTLYHDKSKHLHVKFTGHPFFHEFMDDPYIKRKFLEVGSRFVEANAVGQVLPEPSKPTGRIDGMEDSIIDTFLKEDIQSLQVDSKRKLIGAAVLGKDLKKRKMWSEEYRPKDWWPENLPFRSPNAAPKFDVRELDAILESCSRYIQSKSEHHTNDMAAEGRQAEEIIEDDKLSPEEDKFIEATLAPYRHCLWDNDTCHSFLKAIAGASKLSVLQELLEILPEHLEPDDASLVGEKDIHMWLRHLVPDELRDAGKEPISVKADGTCMFRSISVAIYGNEDNWCFVKLRALKYGTLHFDDVIKRLQRIDQGCGSLCHQITDSATLNEYSHLKDPVERLKACTVAEIVKSVDFYRFGTLLHLVLISGAMKANINCLSKREILEQKILHDDAEMDVAIMWVPTLPNGNVNHIVPLIEPFHKSSLPRNSDNCDMMCNGVPVCSRIFGYATEARFISCHYCLRRYHEYCVGECFVQGEKWNCSCYVNIDALTSLPKLNDKEEAKKLLLAHSKDIEKFSANISKKLIFSPRIFMFEANRSELLRQMHDFTWLVDSSVEQIFIEFVNRVGNQIKQFKGLNLSRRGDLHIDVLFPEILAYLIHHIDNISMTRAREIIHRRV